MTSSREGSISIFYCQLMQFFYGAWSGEEVSVYGFLKRGDRFFKFLLLLLELFPGLLGRVCKLQNQVKPTFSKTLAFSSRKLWQPAHTALKAQSVLLG